MGFPRGTTPFTAEFLSRSTDSGSWCSGGVFERSIDKPMSTTITHQLPGKRPGLDKEIKQAIANPSGQQERHNERKRSTTGNRLISATLTIGERQINRQITDRIGDGEHTNGGMEKRQLCTDGCFKGRERSRFNANFERTNSYGS
jgi:hypothetical protein